VDHRAAGGHPHRFAPYESVEQGRRGRSRPATTPWWPLLRERVDETRQRLKECVVCKDSLAGVLRLR
jgi:hypothetical protein